MNDRVKGYLLAVGLALGLFVAIVLWSNEPNVNQEQHAPQATGVEA